MKKFNQYTNEELVNMSDNEFEKLFANEFGGKLIDEEIEKGTINEILKPQNTENLINKIFGK